MSVAWFRVTVMKAFVELLRQHRREIIDAPDKIEAFVPELEAIIDEGLVTVEPVRVVLYRAGASAE